MARGDGRTRRQRQRQKSFRKMQDSRARVAEATGRRVYSRQSDLSLQLGGRKRGTSKGGMRRSGAMGGGTSEGPDLLLWGSLALGAFLLLKK